MDKENQERVRRQLSRLIENSAGGCSLAGLQVVRRLFHEEVARVAAPMVEAALSQMPTSTIDQRRAMASYCNELLGSLGLRLKSVTGRPAILVCDLRSGEDESPRFRLRAYDKDEGEGVWLWTGTKMPPIELMPAPARGAKPGRQR